jgi:hypothetical protein
MSTKCSIAYYKEDKPTGFHFYHECMDRENVYLELVGDGVEYEARAGRVMVRIPIEVWEVIRKRAPADVSAADWTDEEIDAKASAEADGGVREYERHVAEGNELALRWTAICGLDKSREEQMVSLREHRLQQREEHRARRDRIRELEAKQR